MPNLRIFGLKFEITIVIFEISALEFVLLQSLVQNEKNLKNREKNFVKKMKIPKFGSKNALFGYFWLEFENTILIFAMNPRICLIIKFCEKSEMPKFGTKNT